MTMGYCAGQVASQGRNDLAMTRINADFIKSANKPVSGTWTVCSEFSLASLFNRTFVDPLPR